MPELRLGLYAFFERRSLSGLSTKSRVCLSRKTFAVAKTAVFQKAGRAGGDGMITNSNETGAGKTALNRQNFLEQTRLSRLPKLPPRTSNLVTATKATAVCINCAASLKSESEFARRIRVCAACLAIYTKIDDAITRANESRAYSGDK